MKIFREFQSYFEGISIISQAKITFQSNMKILISTEVFSYLPKTNSSVRN